LRCTDPLATVLNRVPQVHIPDIQQ
jgi:hypothetical protein